MSAGRLLREARRAAKLVQGEVAVPPLQIDPVDLQELGVPSGEMPAIIDAGFRDQLRALRPYADRYLRQQKAAKVERARKLAQRHADDLLLQAERTPEGVVVQPEHLAELAGVVGIDTILLTDVATVVLPRLYLRRVMKALTGTKAKAVVEPSGLRLRYTTRAGGGGIYLVGAHAPRGEIAIVDLQQVGRPVTAEKAPGMAPTNGKQLQPPTPRSQNHPLLSGLLDALADLLAA